MSGRKYAKFLGKMELAEVRKRLKHMAQTKTAIGPRDELALRLAEKALDKARRRPDGVGPLEGRVGYRVGPKRVVAGPARPRPRVLRVTKIDGKSPEAWIAGRRAAERKERELAAAKAARVAELASKMTVLGSDVPDRMPASFSVVSGGSRPAEPERVTSRPEVDGPIRVDALLRPVE